MKLEDLLRIIDNKFGGPSDSGCFNFTLGRIGQSWRFTVVNSWQKWMDAGLKHEFNGPTAKRAVTAFMAYAEARKIDIPGLME